MAAPLFASIIAALQKLKPGIIGFVLAKTADEIFEAIVNRDKEDTYRDNAVLASEAFEKFHQRRENIFGTEKTITTYINKALKSTAFGPGGRENRENNIPTAISKVDAEKSFVQYGSIAKSEGYSGKEAVDIVARATNMAIDLMSYSKSESIDEPNQAIKQALRNNFEPLREMGVTINRELVNQQFRKYYKEGHTGEKYRLQALLDAIEKNNPKVKGHYKAGQRTADKESFYYEKLNHDVAKSNYHLGLGTKVTQLIKNHYEQSSTTYKKESMNLKNISEGELQHIFNFDPSKLDTLLYRLESFINENKKDNENENPFYVDLLRFIGNNGNLFNN